MKTDTSLVPRGSLMSMRFWLVCLAAFLIPVLPLLGQSESHLVGHWKLDENDQGHLVTDALAGEMHGSLNAVTAERSVAGKIGRAIRFPAAGSIRLDQKAAALGKLTDFAISMWIQYDGGPSRLLFTFSDGTLNHRIQVEVHNGALGFGWQNGGSWQNHITKPLAWESGRWYHVVFVNKSKSDKSILRSNDMVWKTHANTL